MTSSRETAPGNALAPRVDGFDWRGALRLGELVIVVFFTLSSHAFWSQASASGTMLGICAAAWLWWLGCRWSVTRGRTAEASLTLPRAARTQSFIALLVVVLTGGALAARPGCTSVVVLSLIAALTAGTEHSLWCAIVVCALAGVSVEAASVHATVPTRLSLAMAPVLALLLGRARRERYEQLRQTRLLYEQTKLAETEHQRAGALAERARIAREIHDVLAHSLGALAIQLELAEVMLTENDDIEQATARIRQSRELTDQGLTETRRAVRALRADAPPLPEAIAGLAAAQRAGDRSAVDFDTEGEPRPLSAEINLALLRTAQEALVNAAKHAPGHAVRVRLVYRSEETVLSVSDFPTRGVEDNRHPTPAAPPGVGGGYGLAGMRERLALAGGSLVAGPSNEPGASGWTVTARVPA